MTTAASAIFLQYTAPLYLLASGAIFLGEKPAKLDYLTVAVAFCDVDDFKAINDTYGHLAGDAVLQSLADSIRAHVRDVDHVARFGGDEILVVLDGVRDLTDAERISDSVRRRVQAPIRYGHDLLDVTMSIGVTIRAARQAYEMFTAHWILCTGRTKKSSRFTTT